MAFRNHGFDLKDKWVTTIMTVNLQNLHHVSSNLIHKN